MKKLILLIFWALAFLSYGNTYSPEECQGSLRPYPNPTVSHSYPDSLKPVFINHIGRHGSRFPASSATALYMLQTLKQADSIGTLTPLGHRFLNVIYHVVGYTGNRWGDLDSLGMAEQRGIADRMCSRFPSLMKNATVNAIATYSPRAVMSMYSFTHKLTEFSKDLSVTTHEGRTYSPVLRPFDDDPAYLNFRNENLWKEPYDSFCKDVCPIDVAKRLLGASFPADDNTWRQIAINEYYIIAGMKAMGLDFDYKPFFSLKEYNLLWSIFNLRQYIQRTATTVSTIPADIATPLLNDLIETADNVLAKHINCQVALRFAHAETLMPLLSLLKLHECYYLTHYFDTVSLNWKDFDVVPMAANLQMIYFTSPSGDIYVRTDLNETPVSVIPGHNEIYIKWSRLREYMLSLSQY